MATPLSLQIHPIPSPPPQNPPLMKDPKPQSPTMTPTHPNPSLQPLSQCKSMSELKQIHAQSIKLGLSSDPFFAAGLIAFCALETSGSLSYAHHLFSQIPNPTPFACNSIIRAHTNRGSHRDAVLFYRRMINAGLAPDRFTFPSLFKSCGDLFEGRQLHCHASKAGLASDSYVQNTMIDMYSRHGCLTSAWLVFNKIEDRNVVTWATMIDACTNHGRPAEALELFDRMGLERVEPNEVVLVNALTACASTRDLDAGTRIYEYIIKNQIEFTIVLKTALINMYCKCDRVALAREIFERSPDRNLVCWNAMINGHVEDSDYKEVLALFREMQARGMKPDNVTLSSLLTSCSHLGALELGRWFHRYIERESVHVDVVLGTALVDMYAKCGCLENAMRVFRGLARRDVMTWTAMIGGLAMSGRGAEALGLFEEIKKDGVRPDAVTFIGVLSACSHAGLVDEGLAHFNSMSEAYNVTPTVEHYGCLVDLLGRAGRVERAEEVMRSMPMAPDHYVLGALLGACRLHGNVEVAERTARALLALDPSNGGAYVVLSNIYCSMKRFEEAERIREAMRQRKIKKPPGCSLIEVDGVVHEFGMGDRTHGRVAEIYAMVDDMVRRAKERGYAPDKASVLRDMEEEEKESALCKHSEKLAVAFGLLSTGPGTLVRVMKNPRICGDCHSMMKLVSEAYRREIVVCDYNRFHQFKDGSCSCNDFW